jgi:hypothetical protein
VADRNRRILVAVLALAAVLLIGYAALTVFLISRGTLEVGPLRVATLVANIVAGGLSLWAAIAFARQKPPSK